jgi:hypothetical protein
VAVQPDPPTRPPSVSPLLVGCLVAAIAASIGLGVLTIMQLTAAPPLRPPPPTANGSGRPPPPGSLSTAFIIVAALFAIAWVGAIVAFSRDHILRRIDRARAEISAELSAGMAEYGDLRETEGYVHGRRQGLREAAGPDRGGEVLKLRPVD